MPAKDYPDAGLRSIDHYKQRLPRWRYYPRELLIPLVRWETPYVAHLQQRLRSPALDSYFSMSANLGTHTFFLVFLPILFWCGWTRLGRGMIHILASGVFFSGFIKDLLCLPRPLSPPLQRITMSNSAALEYGFPSTHSTNAVSVAVYILLMLQSAPENMPPMMRLGLQIGACCYAGSIVLGRLYCGMHGFFDVTVGSMLGAVFSITEWVFMDRFDEFVYSGSSKTLFIVILVVMVLVRIHPEPADDCPCFDDSVAFAGVFAGIELGSWLFARSDFSWDVPVPATVPYELNRLGWVVTLARIALGVACIIVWKEASKKILLRVLPPVFRVVTRLGLSLPRRFFTPATQYKNVPEHVKTDTIIPPASEIIPTIISSIRGPRHGRTVSVGPQSAADAYEAIAFREKVRRNSITNAGPLPSPLRYTFEKTSNGLLEEPKSLRPRRAAPRSLPTPPMTATSSVDNLAIDESALLSPLTPSASPSPSEGGSMVRSPSEDRRQDAKDDIRMFEKLQKPRVRYDVEVITKLIVYGGIAWIAVEGGPILFYLTGLGLEGKGKT